MGYWSESVSLNRSYENRPLQPSYRKTAGDTLNRAAMAFA